MMPGQRRRKPQGLESIEIVAALHPWVGCRTAAAHREENLQAPPREVAGISNRERMTGNSGQVSL
jgi:hypothetical protein